MYDPQTVIYVFYGENEYEITEFVSELESQILEPASEVMNLTRLDERSFNPDELLSVAGVMPFLAERRMVVLTNPRLRLSTPSERKEFLKQLGKIPPTTVLVLVEHISQRDIKNKKINWLQKWAEGQTPRVFIKNCLLPKQWQLEKWIQARVKMYGGEISRPAAELLSSLIDGQPRTADQEINKLLAYVNYQRPIEFEDVEKLTADITQGDIFTLVDALGNQNCQAAMTMLERLMANQEPILIFGMVVRQFRLLLLGREILDEGGNMTLLARQYRLPGFVIDRLIQQIRRYSQTDLEKIYHQLLQIDEKAKTGAMPIELGLETFVATFTD